MSADYGDLLAEVENELLRCGNVPDLSGNLFKECRILLLDVQPADGAAAAAAARDRSSGEEDVDMHDCADDAAAVQLLAGVEEACRVARAWEEEEWSQRWGPLAAAVVELLSRTHHTQYNPYRVF